MTLARALVSQRVVVGWAEQRLENLTAEFAATHAHRCVVLEPGTEKFLGLVRLADIAGRKNPAMRILADLVSATPPPILPDDATVADIATLLEQPEINEVVLVDTENRYFGLIAVEEVYAWLRSQQRQEKNTHDKFLASVSYELRTPLNPIMLIAGEQATRDDLPDNAKAAFAEIEKNARDENSLIEQYLLKRTHQPAPWPEEQAEASLAPSTPASDNRRQPVILMVEDHASSRAAMRLFLQRHQYTVLEAGTAEAALALAAKQPIDLVISDIGLPDQSGYELMEQLRTRHGLSGIAVSAFDDTQHSKAAGFFLHLTKPLAGKTLEKVLSAYFTMERAAGRRSRLA